jgi:hypothetical protein
VILPQHSESANGHNLVLELRDVKKVTLKLATLRKVSAPTAANEATV